MAGPTSLTSDAAAWPRAECSHLQYGHRRVKKGQQHQQALHFPRAMQRHTIVAKMVTYSAVISACENGKLPQQTAHLLRAVQRHAIGGKGDR